MFKIGIDVGGTFTDLVVTRPGEAPRLYKTPSTPQDPSEGVMNGLLDVAQDYGLEITQLLSGTSMIIHGTTVATNTLVERKGAKVGLITTGGFRDLLEMREGMKEDRYNLRMKQMEALVPRYLRIGVPERTRADGSIKTELDEAAVAEAVKGMLEEGVEGLAVCFLFSYLNPEHERRVGEIIEELAPGLYTSLSHEILPQIKEFDRLSTTVVNSYVGPVFGRYLTRLNERLAAFSDSNDILIMQSNGGVTPIDDAKNQAVKAILSGPAGGVAGAKSYGDLVGEANLIGFDMGGTSTDISLIEDGVPHVTTEQFEAGWKIAVPMIDIHTLGAGGGSIARVDQGGILRVGPESAGAEPGPACYGKGGDKPTVADSNLVLGFLSETNFLGGRESLDRAKAEEALDKELVGLGMSTVEAAFGVHQVVSTNMAEGIRLLAARRGVDPRDFSLLAFGGSAGLHVSEMARQLHIERIYVPSTAPVQSAYGMLSTDLRYDFSLSHPVSLDSIDLGEVRRLSAEMGERGKNRLREQGVSDEDISVSVSADMRYLDQIFEVNVPVPDLSQDDSAILEQLSANLHRRYQELYSYQQSDQEVRLVTLRASVFGALDPVDLPKSEGKGRLEDALKGKRSLYLSGWADVPVYDMDKLPASWEMEGPAIVESDFTTILLQTGDRAVADGYGGMRMQVAIEEDEVETDKGEGGKPDPITVAVVESRLNTIALEMAEVMIRTSMSQILNSSRDFSTAIIDADCQLVAQGEGIPVHISALPLAAAAVKQYFGDRIYDGDMFALNDPYFGGSHIPDITVIQPIFYEGKLRFFAVNRAHHSDVGGATHGGYNPSASEIYQEGIRIPPLKLIERGVARDDVLHMLSANVRHPENFLGDFQAQFGSVRIAARRIIAMLERYGAEGLSRAVDEILHGTEVQVREMITNWPDGVYKGESFIDDDGFDAKMVPIRATVTIAGDSMTIDLSESSKQVTGFINSAYANTRSLSHVSLMYMAPFDVARNEGSMRPITVIAPKGLIVNPYPPAPVTMSTNHCGEEIVEAVFRAMVNAVPDAVTAGFSRRLRYAITGEDPKTGRRFIWHFFLGRGGGGASDGFDGWSNVGEINVAGGIRSPSVEVTEERFPFFIPRYELLPDSAGDGRWRGGLGSVVELVYEGEPGARMNTAGDGIVNPPFGLLGGSPGWAHRYSIVSEDGGERVLRSKETGVPVKPGDTILCYAAGGGGYGDPALRDEDIREQDLRNGYCT